MSEHTARQNQDEPFFVQIDPQYIGLHPAAASASRRHFPPRWMRYIWDDWIAGPRTSIVMQGSGLKRNPDLLGDFSARRTFNKHVGINMRVSYRGVCIGPFSIGIMRCRSGSN